MTGSDIIGDTERKRFYPITDKKLGIRCCGNSTIFRLWAPTAEAVEVNLYPDENKREIRETLALSPAKDGVWELEVPRYLAGNYYIYRLNFDGRTTETIDPWAFAAGTDSELGLIVDLERTDPEGWEKDSRIELENPVDAVIYELHIRDFSMSPASGIKNKGKYLA
ncbi:MAG: type I pullulanase, partial [Halanaerobiales bacterium]